MAAETQTPLMPAVEDRKACNGCCEKRSDDSSHSVDFSNSSIGVINSQTHNQPCCGGGKVPRNRSKCRLQSCDSGCSGLEPIAEYLPDGKPNIPENGMSNSRSSSGINMRFLIRESDEMCSSQDVNHCCGHGHVQHAQERPYVSPRTHCQCNQNHTNEMPINYSATSLTTNPIHPIVSYKGERMRSKSESCTDSESILSTRRSDAYLIPNQIPTDVYYEPVSSNEFEKAIPKERKKKRGPTKLCLCVVFILIVIIAVGFTIVFLFLQNYRIKEMENKIKDLEQKASENDGQPISSSYSGMMKRSRSDVRPHAHLTLKRGENVELTKWKQHILNWTPHIVEGQNSLKYDEDNRCLIVHEAGIYFVYNQIYVQRHIDETRRGMKGVSNHTMFHTIYSKPFNYPSNRIPMVLTESALSHCWSEDADTQVHTSYQGIIVKLQVNDRLLVALDDFNDHVDKLDPKATFFGVFKI